jgi:hypothetical protein
MHVEVATLLFVALAGCGGGPSRIAAAARPRIARLTAREGVVDVLRAGAVDWEHLEAGVELFEDDRVRTFKAAWAQLDFTGGSSLRLDEESLISLGAGVVVERGSLAGELKPGLKLHTPSAEAESVAARDIVFR